MSNQTPQPGEWWIDGTGVKREIVAVSGGELCTKNKFGGLSVWHTKTVMEYWASAETWPKFYTTIDSCTTTVAYIRRDDQSHYTTVKKDGTETSGFRWLTLMSKSESRSAKPKRSHWCVNQSQTVQTATSHSQTATLTCARWHGSKSTFREEQRGCGESIRSQFLSVLRKFRITYHPTRSTGRTRRVRNGRRSGYSFRCQIAVGRSS